MSGIPNTFQCFNIYIDRAMELLTDAEFRCLMFATRHILGWQDKVNSRQGRLSISTFQNGFEDSKGNHYGGVGYGRAAIIAAVDELVTYGFMERVGKAGSSGQRYQISESDINWKALEARKAEKDQKNKRRTTKATRKSQAKRAGTSDVTGTSHVTAVGTSDVTATGTSDVTQSNPSTNTHQKQISLRYARVLHFTLPLLNALAHDEPDLKIVDPDKPTYQQWLTELGLIFHMSAQAAELRHWYNLFNGRAATGKWKEGNITPAATLEDVKRWNAYEVRLNLQDHNKRENPHTGKFRNALSVNAAFLTWREKRDAIEADKARHAEIEATA